MRSGNGSTSRKVRSRRTSQTSMASLAFGAGRKRSLVPKAWDGRRSAGSLWSARQAPRLGSCTVVRQPYQSYRTLYLSCRLALVDSFPDSCQGSGEFAFAGNSVLAMWGMSESPGWPMCPRATSAILCAAVEPCSLFGLIGSRKERLEPWNTHRF